MVVHRPATSFGELEVYPAAPILRILSERFAALFGNAELFIGRSPE